MSISTAELGAEIRRYCAAHPDAADTLEGIAWWLAIQRYGDVIEELRGVVDALVAEGVLVRHGGLEGTCIFACRPCHEQK